MGVNLSRLMTSVQNAPINNHSTPGNPRIPNAIKLGQAQPAPRIDPQGPTNWHQPGSLPQPGQGGPTSWHQPGSLPTPGQNQFQRMSPGVYRGPNGALTHSVGMPQTPGQEPTTWHQPGSLPTPGQGPTTQPQYGVNQGYGSALGQQALGGIQSQQFAPNGQFGNAYTQSAMDQLAAQQVDPNTGQPISQPQGTQQ